MKVEAKKLDATKVQLDIEVPQEAVKKKFDEVYLKIGKDAKVPGFRPGKAPRDVLEKHHGRLAQEEVIKNLIPEVYKDSIEKEGLNVVELPQVSDIKFESGILSFRAVVEVMPKIEIKDYKNIKIKSPKITVTAQEIDKTIDQLKEANKASQVDDKFARAFGYKTLEHMRVSIERQIFMRKESEQIRRIQDDLVRQVVSGVNFVIPKSLITRHLEELVHHAKWQLMQGGMPKEQADSKDQDLRKEFLKAAEEQVKSAIVLEEIAKIEKLPGDGQVTKKALEFLLSEADWSSAE